MNTDEPVRRLTEVLRRKHLAPATVRGYCDYLNGLPFHLPSAQKPERFLTALAGKHVAAGIQNQGFNAVVFSSNMSEVRKAFGEG